ncbi:hypothetical protein NL676_009914 [Syzygium grande]|nr:hypothetical protein NL676_009914 [Syzygium grande]
MAMFVLDTQRSSPSGNDGSCWGHSHVMRLTPVNEREPGNRDIFLALDWVAFCSRPIPHLRTILPEIEAGSAEGPGFLLPSLLIRFALYPVEQKVGNILAN